MLPFKENAAGKVAPLGNTINPGHGVFVPAGLGERKELIQPDELGGLLPDAA